MISKARSYGFPGKVRPLHYGTGSDGNGISVCGVSDPEYLTENREAFRAETVKCKRCTRILERMPATVETDR